MSEPLPLTVEDALTVFINDKPMPIFELDTMESFKLRVANQARDSNNQPRPILPSLILLEEKVVAPEITESKIPIKTTAGCKAIHIKHPQLQRINPLSQRKFRLLDFGILCRLRIESAGLDRKKQRKFADELVELFNLPDIQGNPEPYIKYALYFGFGGLQKFNDPRQVNPNTRIGFIDAVKTTLGFRNWDIVELHWEDDWAAGIKTELKSLSLAVQQDLNLFNSYRKELAPYETITSKLQLDQTQLSVKFTITTDVYEIFNGARLSQAVPFCAIGDFYKVLKTFKPPKEWAVKCSADDNTKKKNNAFMRECELLSQEPGPSAGNEIMVIYVLNRLRETEKNKINPDPHNYSTVFIIPGIPDEKSHEMEVEMRIQSRIDDELREEKLLTRIFEVFPFPVLNCSYEQKKVVADFLMVSPGNFDIPLFYDMVLTDPLISQIMLINESSQTFRERGGIFSYFRYNKHVEPKRFMSCRITPGIVEAKDEARAPELFKTLGKKLIRIKIMNCENQIEAERFKDILSQIIDYYYEGEEISENVNE